MARRKATGHLDAAQGQNHDQKISTREYYNQRYEETVKGAPRTALYSDNTNYHINRIEGLWREYCKFVRVDPYHTLKRCEAARIENFLHWMLNTYTIKKTSTVTTYWHQLSQLYITWKGRRMDPMILKQIYVFIEGRLTEEHRLDDSETEKPMLEAEDFLEVLRYHWVTDMNVFPTERQRVQLATIMLAAAFTGSRPGALLAIEYRDLDLFVIQHPETKEHTLVLKIKLTKTKSRGKRKRPKTYTFYPDNNPVFCIISHLLALAFDDDAYAAPGLTSPEQLFLLRVKRGVGCQPIPWKKEVQSKPVFCAAVRTEDGICMSKYQALSYGVYHSWVKRLGEDLGFTQVLTTYCLRRATGNAINDDVNSNDAVRNLIMDHTNSRIFERNYLSRQIRYDTQAAFLGYAPNNHLIRASGWMSRLMDPRRPKRLSDEQKAQVQAEAEIQKLSKARTRLYADIRSNYGFLSNADEAIRNRYQELVQTLKSSIRARERALLKQIQARHDAVAPVNDIQQQINGDVSDDDCALVPQKPQHKLVERRRIAEALFLNDPATFGKEKGLHRRTEIISDMIELCRRRERRTPRTRRGRDGSYVKTVDDQQRNLDCNSPTSASESELFPLECKPYQCLFCLGSGELPLENRVYSYASKDSLKRHVDRCRLNLLKTDKLIACPHPHIACARIILEGITHFKNHAARVHKIFM